MNGLKIIVIVLFIIMLPMIEAISRKVPLLDAILPIVTLIGIIALFRFIIKIVKLKIKQAKELKKEKLKILHRESSELVDIIQKIYEDSKEVLDNGRRKYVWGNIILIFSITISAYLCSKYFCEEKLYEKVVPSIIFYSIMLIEGIVLVMLFYKFMYKYKTLLGKNMINTFLNYSTFKLKYYINLQNFQKEACYNGNKYEEIIQEYSNAVFDNENIDGYEIEDYITGCYNDISIQFMDANLYKIQGGKGSGRRYIFCGNLAIVDKGINDNHIKIISKRINDFNIENQSTYYKFDEYFNIYARDMDKTKDSLSSNLKNFLLDFRKKYKLEFDIVLNEKIYVRFYTKDMFKLKVFDNPIDEESIYQFYAITKFIEGLLEVLNK